MSNAILMSGGADDIDFMIHGLFSYQLFGHTVWITTSHVCILLVMLVILIFAIIANRKIKHATEVPDGFQNVIELLVEKLDGIVMGTMGKIAGPKFSNYICTIFVFIFISNISGLFGLRPPTADYGTTLALGLITFFLIHITQFKNLPLKQIWVDMCSPLPPWLPIWFPINVISEIAVPISLSLRLFANVLSGTVMMALVYGLLSKIAIIWPAALHVYFDLFSGAIQTYVFCMLTMTYISQNYEQEELTENKEAKSSAHQGVRIFLRKTRRIQYEHYRTGFNFSMLSNRSWFSSYRRYRTWYWTGYRSRTCSSSCW